MTSFFANLTAASQASLGNGNIEAVGGQKGPKLHYLTTMSVLGPESLSVYPTPVETGRRNAYPLPGTYNQLASGLPVFQATNCTGPAPSISAAPGETPTPKYQELIQEIQEFKVANKPETANDVAAPPCRQQAPFSYNGQTSQFPHVTYPEK